VEEIDMRGGFALAGVILLGSVLVFSSAAVSEDGGKIRLDLDTCVETAIQVNISVLKAGYDLDRSRYTVLGSTSSLLPSVGWSSSDSRWQTPSERWVGDQILYTNRSYSSSFGVAQSLSFGNIMGVLGSLSDKNVSEQNLRAVRQQVVYTAKQKYLEVLRAKRLLGVSEEAMELSKRRQEKAQALLDVGSGVKSDVLRAQVEASSNELDLISARNSLRLAEADLKHFLTIEDEREIELEDILETGENAYALDAALADAMEMRPDIRAQAAMVKSDSRGVWRTRGGWIPTLGFNWSRSYTAPADDPTFPDRVLDVWDDGEWSWRLSLNVNIFDGFGTFSQVKIAKAQLKSARQDLSQSRRDASLEVTKAYYNVEEARQRVKISKETVSLAEEELRLAEERYRLGGGTMLEQIDAQVTLSQARTSYIQALYDYLLSQAELVRATGKD
jgi:outer membrane protein